MTTLGYILAIAGTAFTTVLFVSIVRFRKKAIPAEPDDSAHTDSLLK